MRLRSHFVLSTPTATNALMSAATWIPSSPGPATLIGDNPFSFADYGAVGGALCIRSEPGRTGLVEVTARHAELGYTAVRVSVTTPEASSAFP